MPKNRISARGKGARQRNHQTESLSSLVNKVRTLRDSARSQHSLGQTNEASSSAPQVRPAWVDSTPILTGTTHGHLAASEEQVGAGGYQPVYPVAGWIPAPSRGTASGPPLHTATPCYPAEVPQSEHYPKPPRPCPFETSYVSTK